MDVQRLLNATCHLYTDGTMIQSGQCCNALLLPLITNRQYAVKQYSLYPDHESSLHGCSPQYERTRAEAPLIYLLTYSLRHRRVVKRLVAKGCQHLSPKQTHEGGNTE